MKLSIIDKTGKKKGDFEFTLNEEIRSDLFKRAVDSETSLFRQETGADPEAGKKHSISLSKRRRKFRTTYGRGQSRTPRKTMWARGRQMRYVGAFAPQTVGGRKAHAPTAEKKLFKNMNNKEWLKALRCGVLASFHTETVRANGQRVPETYPFILDSTVEEMNKTKDFKDFLMGLGFAEEFERVSKRTVRAGKGTARNRTYRDKRGPLVVVSSIEAPLLKAARNVKSFDVITPDLLMVSDFGMAHNPGRAVLFTQKALEEFKEVLE